MSLSRADLIAALAARPAREAPRPAGGLRQAAVLMPVIEDPRRGFQVVLTRRAANLRSHAGQISFPGGKIDSVDKSPRHAALREAHEEIGLAPHHVDILGQLDPCDTSTGFWVTPFLGMIEPGFEPTPNPGEVAEVFTVPLEFLMDRENHELRYKAAGRMSFVMTYQTYEIWGATAAILRGLSEDMRRSAAREAS